MQNHGILDPRAWSTVRRTQVLGALAGILLTFGMPFAWLVSARLLGEHWLVGLLFLSHLLVLAPAFSLLRIIGMDDQYTSTHVVITSLLVLFINAVLSFIVSTLIALAFIKRKNDPRPI